MTREVTSASNIHRRQLCPGSERMEAGLPEENSEQAAEGKLLHEHMANPALDRSLLTREQRDILVINEKLVREIYEAIQARFGDLPAGKGGRENITLWLHRGIRKLFPGHPDLWECWAHIKLLLIADFKFGRRVVTPAAANLQLGSYGAMGSELHDCDFVCVAITQPRLSKDERLTIAIYAREEIDLRRRQLFDLWDACKKPDAPLNAGEEQCRYCRARGPACPAFTAMIEGAQQLVPMPLGTPERKKHDIRTAISKCSDAQLCAFLEARALFSYAEDIAITEARRRISEGGLPGYKLGKESEVREVTDVEIAIERLTAVGIDPTDIYQTCKMKLGQVEDLFRDVKGGTWSETKDAVNQLLADVITRHPKLPAIVKDPNPTTNRIAA